MILTIIIGLIVLCVALIRVAIWLDDKNADNGVVALSGVAGVVCGILGAILLIGWPVQYDSHMSEQIWVDSFISSDIHQEYLEILQSSPESVIQLEVTGKNMGQWYRDVKQANCIIEDHRRSNANFWDPFYPDWNSPDPITFQKGE